MAVVEPGVTYGELQEALEKEGMELSGTLAPKATKSVLASVLDAEPRLNPFYQWNYMDPLRCTEVIWGDGVRMLTGEAGGGANDLEKQQSQDKWQVNAPGPMMLDFYRLLTASQGSMGIVTWASLKCEPLPIMHEMYTAASDNLQPVQDFVYDALHKRFGDELFIANGMLIAMLLGKSSVEMAKLRMDMSEWVAVVGMDGRNFLPELRMKQLKTDLSVMAENQELKLREGICSVSSQELLKAVTQPCEDKYYKDRMAGAHKELFFVTTLDKAQIFISEMQRLAAAHEYPVGNLGIYLQPLHQGASCHCEFIIPYDPKNEVYAGKAKRLYADGMFRMSELGGFFSRPYGVGGLTEVNRNPEGEKVLRKLKDIFDPHGIMNPGKVLPQTGRAEL